jgi:hypothetical protein
VAGGEEQDPVAQLPPSGAQRAGGLGSDDAVGDQPARLLERPDRTVDRGVELLGGLAVVGGGMADPGELITQRRDQRAAIAEAQWVCGELRQRHVPISRSSPPAPAAASAWVLCRRSS